MREIEFTAADLSESRNLSIPEEVAAKFPTLGSERIIVLPDERSGDEEWRLGAYQQFLREDSAEDAIYDS